ncbi:hypothetical protein AURDEDRAFT_162210 [Auricularia subglabra TFB-10046 SS5]|nr:hypothetical protein AURDEDRAFT_162210 [Auricularia subglabra TFB-10046 SS5]
MSYQNVLPPTFPVGTRVTFVQGGVQYTGTVSALTFRSTVPCGVVATVRIDTSNTPLVVAVSLLRPA